VTVGQAANRAGANRAPLHRQTPRIEYGSFRSAAVDGRLRYTIALPPGYATSGKRYPVVYFLHGLPANAHA
jgi:predicted alpha/beta superfamily hydrolase